jgi:hypothetical protein
MKTWYLFHLGISCTVFVLICTVVVLFCNVCIYVCVCVCVGFVICGCFVNVYSTTLTEVFPCFFLSCKTNARVKLAKTGHGPHSSKLVVICVVLLLFVLFYVLLVCKCVLYYFHRVTTQLQWTNIWYHIIYTISFCLINTDFFFNVRSSWYYGPLG